MLTRRTLLAMAAATAAAPGQTAPLRYREYARCLPDVLRRLAQEAYVRRRQALAQLTTPAAIRRRQQWARRTFWQLIGGEPERTPLQARTLGGLERPGYKLEKLVYESRPGWHITANLYVPTVGQPPYPGVLFQMGHSLDGKAYETYQKCCQGLARLGFLVLGFDPMGQGERIYYPDASGTRTRLESADDEHTLPGQQMLLHGDTCTRLQMWDAVRSLDYLAGHPLVDPQRLATAGQSGGATLSMMLAAVDDRLAAAALSSGNTENFACARFDPPGSTDDAEQNFVQAGPAGFDRWDLLYPFAPKPLLVMVSARDFFGTYSPKYIESGLEEFAHLKAVYTRLGAPARLAWADTPQPHSLAYYPRLRTYKWLRQHLQPGLPAVEREPDVAPEPLSALRVTARGNVVAEFGGATPFKFNQTAPQREAGDWRELLRIETPPAAARFTTLATVPSQGLQVDAVEVASALEVFVPAWLYRPEQTNPHTPLLLILEPSGRSVRWAEGGLYHQIAARGGVVCAADVRGVGDLAPEFSRGAPRYSRPHQSEDSYAWASLILGRPLVGQRVADILALVSALSAHAAGQGRAIRVAALGKMTVPALFAAALEPKISSLYLAGGLISCRSLIETEDYKHAFANFVPGLLKRSDLPQIAATLAPRLLTLAGPVDAADRPVPESEVRRLYSESKHIQVLPRAEWTAERLAV